MMWGKEEGEKMDANNGAVALRPGAGRCHQDGRTIHRKLRLQARNHCVFWCFKLTQLIQYDDLAVDRCGALVNQEMNVQFRESQRGSLFWQLGPSG